MNSTRTRIRIVAVCVLFFASLLFIKLYSLQIIHYQDFADRADRQYQRPSDAFNRGTIYFSDKNGGLISAATLKTGFILALNPKIIQKNNSADSVLLKLQKYIDLDTEEFYAKSSASSTYQELLKRLDQEIGEKIAKEKIPGVLLFKDKWRYYPGGELAAHALGFMAYKGNELAGRYGLERTYDSVLARKND
jgi:cell division protein FtsI/penicillin-binding protein 2